MINLEFFILGTFFGVFLMCCMQISKNADKHTDRYMEAKNNEK